MAVGFGSFMATLDFGIINLALPAFGRAFERGPDAVVWLSLAASLIVAGLTLTAGRSGDLYGRRRIYLAGWLLFTLALVPASFADSLEALIGWRLVQAVGLSLAIANANAIVTDVFPAPEWGRALGTVTAIVGAGLLSGPLLGGFILDALDWRAIFYLRIPIGIAALIVALAVVHESEPVDGQGLDLAGAVTLFTALGSLVLLVNRAQAWGWTSPIILGLGALGVGSLLLFVRIEERTPSPIVAPALLRQRGFVVPIVSLALIFVAQASVTFLMPFYLIEVRALPPVQTGLILAMVPLMLLLFAPLSGQIFDRTGWRWQATLGVSTVGLGLLSLACLGPATPVYGVLLRLAVVGLGLAIFMPGNASSIMGTVPREMLGTASASVATSRNIGTAIGLAIISAVLVAAAGGAGPDVASAGLPPERMLVGIRAAFGTAAGLSLLAVIASLLRASAR
jgi:EmrB/QacA subfamily drug resistance transporter